MLVAFPTIKLSPLPGPFVDVSVALCFTGQSAKKIGKAADFVNPT
jgi:hypothetical protein